jgi:hypothetical protein
MWPQHPDPLTPRGRFFVGLIEFHGINNFPGYRLQAPLTFFPVAPPYRWRANWQINGSDTSIIVGLDYDEPGGTSGINVLLSTAIFPDALLILDRPSWKPNAKLQLPRSVVPYRNPLPASVDCWITIWG